MPSGYAHTQVQVHTHVPLLQQVLRMKHHYPFLVASAVSFLLFLSNQNQSSMAKGKAAPYQLRLNHSLWIKKVKKKNSSIQALQLSLFSETEFIKNDFLRTEFNMLREAYFHLTSL